MQMSRSLCRGNGPIPRPSLHFCCMPGSRGLLGFGPPEERNGQPDESIEFGLPVLRHAFRFVDVIGRLWVDLLLCFVLGVVEQVEGPAFAVESDLVAPEAVAVGLVQEAGRCLMPSSAMAATVDSPCRPAWASDSPSTRSRSKDVGLTPIALALSLCSGYSNRIHITNGVGD